MDASWAGRVALVTGAASGLGRATALELAEAGIDRPGYLTDIDLTDHRRVQAVNGEGPVLLTSEFRKRMQDLPDVRHADVVHVVPPMRRTA